VPVYFRPSKNKRRRIALLAKDRVHLSLVKPPPTASLSPLRTFALYQAFLLGVIYGIFQQADSIVQAIDMKFRDENTTARRIFLI